MEVEFKSPIVPALEAVQNVRNQGVIEMQKTNWIALHAALQTCLVLVATGCSGKLKVDNGQGEANDAGLNGTSGATTGGTGGVATRGSIGVVTGGTATVGTAIGGVATGGVATGGVATGGVTTGGVATGGVATGGVATGGVATGGVATGGVATGGVATGGTATGGAQSAAGAAPDAGPVAPGSDRGCGPGSGSGLSNGSDPARDHAEKAGLSTLELMLGQYIDGSSPVYRGSLQAHSNESVFQGSTDEDISLGPAVAELQRNHNSGALGVGSSLFIHSLETQRYIELQQSAIDPTTTNVGMVLEHGWSGGLYGPCVSCAPDFATAPATIAVDNAKGSYEALTNTVSTNLTLAAPCSVTLAELQIIERNTFVEFVASGNELVWHRSGQYFVPGANGCGPATPYTIDLFFDPVRPWVFGVRNYTVTGSSFQSCRT